MERIRTVIVGCGGISNAWMGTQARKDLIDVVGAVDLRREAAEDLIKKHGLPATTAVGTDLAEVLKATRPEVVFDLTVPEAHCAVTVTALEHGCHVLGEKPMADTMDNARRMVRAAAGAKRVYAVTQTRRWNGNLRRLQRFLESGAIGRIHTVHADFFIAAHFGGFREAMDHVLLLDMAIHSFDQGRVLFPGGNPETVIAHEWNPPGSWYRHGASAIAVFAMGEGKVFNYRGSWTATGEQTTWECAWRILGDRGAVTWDGAKVFHAQRVRDPQQKCAGAGGPLIRDLDEIPVPDIPSGTEGGGHDGAIRNFLEAIRADRLPECHGQDNIRSLAMVHAAIAAAGSGRREPVVT